jgi:hypothetical protein
LRGLQLVDKLAAEQAPKQLKKWTKADKRNLKMLEDEMKSNSQAPRSVAVSSTLVGHPQAKPGLQRGLMCSCVCLPTVCIDSLPHVI